MPLQKVSPQEQETQTSPGADVLEKYVPKYHCPLEKEGLPHRDLTSPSISGATLELSLPVSRINGKGAVSMKSNRPASKL